MIIDYYPTPLQRIKTLPEIDGLSKDTVLTSWMAKYDAITKGKTSKLVKSFREGLVSVIKYGS